VGRCMDACDERQTAVAAFRTATAPGAAEIADLLEETARDLAHHLRRWSLPREGWLRSAGAATVTVFASQSRDHLAGLARTP
jgi:hypothetical protein